MPSAEPNRLPIDGGSARFHPDPPERVSFPMRAFAQSIVESVRHPLVVLDPGLRVRSANSLFYRLLGTTEAETEGRFLFELGNGQWDIPRLRFLLGEVISRDGFVEDFEVRHDFPNLGRKVMLLNARRVCRDEDGAPMVLLALEDVTDRLQAREDLQRLNRELEERVRERTARLEAANRELEAFCYSVSHDLRAPLRVLDGFSEELLRTCADRLDATGRHYLERIRAGSRRMGLLIDDLLQLSRIHRGEIRREWVDLTALAETIAADLRQQEPGRLVAFVIEPGLSARGDGSLLRVALENLLGNAWKFTGRKAEATIAFGRSEHEGEPVFSVRDDGVGFDMAHAGKLFGAFQRLHSEREFPGTGIGLATVQRIVHRHGGKVWGEGAPGKGAVFYFTLPQEGSP